LPDIADTGDLMRRVHLRAIATKSALSELRGLDLPEWGKAPEPRNASGQIGQETGDDQINSRCGGSWPRRSPTHQGFDKFHGFLGGATNQWAPFLYDGTAVVELPSDPNYHFMTDMTDNALAWIRYQKALASQKPSFVYFAPGASHAPHRVPWDTLSADEKGLFNGYTYFDGEKVAEGRIENTEAGTFSAAETADVRIDLGPPVVEAIGSEAESRFNGHIQTVTVKVGH
jgi:hypothetical protein